MSVESNFNGESPLISTPELMQELGKHAGQAVRLVGFPYLVAPAYVVAPNEKGVLGTPFWQAAEAAFMDADPYRTPEQAVVAFAAGAKGWIAIASKKPAVDVETELRVRLAAGPAPAAQLMADFAALDVSPDRLGRTARRLGVVRRKAGMAGGWTWEMPVRAGTEVSGAAFEEVGTAFINQDLEDKHA